MPSNKDVPDQIDRSIDRSKSLDRLIDRSTSKRRSIITFKEQQKNINIKYQSIWILILYFYTT